MSYEVLARKYRPNLLSDVVGQDRTVQALTNAFNSDRLHHAYMLSGTRGVGKTTLARIIAKCLNCVEGPTANPCGKCVSCLGIADGSFPDLFEVDGASRNKVEDTRELLDDITYRAAIGRFKVYIIDEVHALSASSFQTLLKSLEEPPEHVKFVLATTDPDSVPVTVRSRCLQFHLRNISNEVIEGRLREILAHESVEFDEESVQEIARLGRGSMRDALSLTDQAISLCGDKLEASEVLDMLGCAPQDDVSSLLKALSEGNQAHVLELSRNISSRGVDYSELLTGLESALHKIAMDKAIKSDSLASWQADIPEDWIQQAYQILIMGGRDLQYGPEPKVGFEMTLLRLMNFTPIRFNQSASDKESVSSRRTITPQKKKPEPTHSPSQVKSVSTGSAENKGTNTRILSPRERTVRNQEVLRVERERKKEAELEAMKVFENDSPNYVDLFKKLFPSAKMQVRIRKS